MSELIIRKSLTKDFINHQAYTQLSNQLMMNSKLGYNLDLEYRYYYDTFKCPLKHHLMKVYSIEVIVNGYKKRFLLDTGAQISALFDDVNIEVVDLKESIEIGSISGQLKAQSLCQVNKLDIQALSLYNVKMVRLPRTNFKMMNINLLKVDGIIGWDILRHFDFTLSNKYLTFIKPKTIKHKHNLVNTSFPSIMVSDASGNLKVLGFDSGAYKSWLSEAEINKMDLKLDQEANAYTIGIHGLEKIPVKIIKEAKFYGINNTFTFKNIHTGITNIFKNVEYSGILANEVLKTHKLVFLNSQNYFGMEEKTK